MKQVSVVIPSFNRAHLLKRIIHSYFQQEVGEVILVNDGSKDNTAEVVEELQIEYPNLKYFKIEKNSGQTVAKNKGIDLAIYDYVYFGDDDSYISENTVGMLLETIKEYDADVVGARALYLLDNGEPYIDENNEKLMNLETLSTNWAIDTNEVLEVPFTHACSLVKVRLAKKIRFDERYKGNGYREETDFFVRLNKAGAKIIYQPKACQINLPRSISGGGSWKGSALWYEFWTMKNNNLFLDSHWDFLKKKYQLRRNKFQMKWLFIFSRKQELFYAILKSLGLYYSLRFIYRKVKK